MLLKGKTAVVTGGTRGIGAAIVRKFLENGAKVAVCGSKKETAEAAAAKFAEEFPNGEIMPIWPALDDADAVARAFAEVKVNLTAVFVCSQAAARIMKEQGGGVIVNTSSMVSKYGQPSGVAYPASKFAVNGLTLSLARELARDNIRVNAVAPGVTRTDMMANVPESVLAPVVAGIPLGRIGEPEDVANAFLFLASDMASYITGAVLPVDGAARS